MNRKPNLHANCSYKLAEDYELETDTKLLAKPHFHKGEKGFMVKCYHESKSLLFNWRFWAGMTLGFPCEHLLWEKVFPFSHITHWLGL